MHVQFEVCSFNHFDVICDVMTIKSHYWMMHAHAHTLDECIIFAIYYIHMWR